MVRWIWAFIDRPQERFEGSIASWRAVTGTRLSARRGEHDEFATLLPPAGEAIVVACWFDDERDVPAWHGVARRLAKREAMARRLKRNAR